MQQEPALADIGSELALAATYTREVRAGVDRIWENVLDWEHLPALHEIYFNHVALIEIGSSGWRVELTKRPGTADRRMLLELQSDRARGRYRVRTLAGDGAGTAILTLLEGLGRSARRLRCASICPSTVRKGWLHWARNTCRATRACGTRTKR